MVTAITDSKERVLSPRDVAAARDQVERERTYARYVITIDEEGNPVNFEENPHPQINVLAVVGPAQVGDVFLEETILLEIGIHRSYPYRRTHGIKNGSPARMIWQRAKHASLSISQLGKVFPEIERVLVEDMRKRTKNWRFVKTGYRTRGLFRGDRNPERTRQMGTRYSVSFQDKAFLATVLRSELENRQVPLEKDLKRAARKISLITSRYRRQYPSEKEFELMCSYPKIIDLYEFLERRNFHPHHYYLLCRALERSEGRFLFERIMKDLQIDRDMVSCWGALMMSTDVPWFRGVHTWCVSNEWRQKVIWSKRYRKEVVTKHKPQHLSFELSDKPTDGDFPH